MPKLKRSFSAYVVVGLTLGLLLSGLVHTNVGCASLPTTQQADAWVATAKGDTAQVGDAVVKLQAVAATQPSVADLQARLTTAKAAAATQPADAAVTQQVANLQAAIAATNMLNQAIATMASLQPKVQQGVNVAAGLEQAVYHNDPTQLVNATAPLIPAPWNLLFAAGVPLIWGLLQNNKLSAVQTLHATVSAALDAATTALGQYAQAVHAIAPDAVVNQVAASVDSSTRAAVAAAGVVHVADPAPTIAATAILQPGLQTVYPLPLGGSNTAGK